MFQSTGEGYARNTKQVVANAMKSERGDPGGSNGKKCGIRCTAAVTWFTCGVLMLHSSSPYSHCSTLLSTKKVHVADMPLYGLENKVIATCPHLLTSGQTVEPLLMERIFTDVSGKSK
jgi:hypothetical protein